MIEEALSKLEGRYAEIFRQKISKRLPLNEEEHITLCAFVAVMLQRTLRHRDNLDRFFDQILERTEALEKQHSAKPTQSENLN